MSTPNLRPMLEQHEGLVLHAYRDSLGYLSIGFGRLIDARKGGKISRAEADFLLTNDINDAIRDCLRAFPWFAGLDGVRQDVIIAMRFNLGLAGLRGFKNTLAAVAGGDYETAARGMLASKWHEQVGERAVYLSELMRTGRYPVVA